MSSGGGGGLGAILANIVISAVMLAILWIPAVCLYPLTSVAGIATSLILMSILSRVLPPDGGDVVSLLSIIGGAIVIFKVFRIEMRLAESATFRMIRHAIRMVLLAIVAIPFVQLTMGATAPSTTTRYILAVILRPDVMWEFLLSPTNLGAWLAAVVALHVVIWHSARARRFWHGRLKWVGLK